MVPGRLRVLAPDVGVEAVNMVPGVPPCPVTLDELLQAVDRSGTFHHLSVSRLNDGRYQVSYKSKDATGYRIVITDDVTEAVQGALGPVYGETWDDVLGDDPLPSEWTEDDGDDLLGELL